MNLKRHTLRRVEWTEGARAIDDCQYLYVEQVGELEELTLDLHLVEAKAQAPITTAKDNSEIEQLKVGSRPIQTDPTCRLFRLLFESKHMISYTVSNELYGRYPQAPEEFTGKLFRVFSNSHLLNYTKRTSYASDDHPGKLYHYEIACLNHVIDVIATEPPLISIATISSDPAYALEMLGGSEPDSEDILRRRPD